MTDVPSTASSLCEAFQNTSLRSPDSVALRTLGDAQVITWRQYAEGVRRTAEGLHAHGVRPGDRVGVMMVNRPEFHIVDTGALHARAVPVSIYNSLPPEQIAWILDDAGVEVMITEARFVPVLLAAQEHRWRARVLVSIDQPAEGALTRDQFETVSTGFDFDASWRAVSSTDLATISYTSGTTGNPKGVELEHRAVLGNLRAVESVLGTVPHPRVVSFLPAAHVAERVFSHYPSILHGYTLTCCPDPADVVRHLIDTRPHYVFSPPRLFEKLRTGIEAAVAATAGDDRKTIDDALALGYEKVDLEQRGAAVPAGLAVRYDQARIHLTRLLGAVGLDHVQVALTGSAPVNPDLLRFFLALGLPGLEGWGLSEACAFATMNRPGSMRLGSAGLPLPGMAIRLLDDGEILLRSPWLMKRYHNRPELTAETIDSEGWLHTGDIGTIDDEGRVAIVDRKKELIINAFGKNMSPANIEATLKDASPLIAQACVIGDNRPYNVALVVVDSVIAGVEVRPHLSGQDRLDAITALVTESVARANKSLARVEQIKKFTLLLDEWLPGGVELSPTMKLRRKAISARYQACIEAMYADASDRTAFTERG
ncbi:long-chain fatty acid--CoA ligase [Rhodococcus olei]|uniref:Long-chain fatty acid--CoA ligase n=1 Tax=Rhodococcus olei TaxID=2161675 RepID=A0ABP8PUB8_9NOCA